MKKRLSAAIAAILILALAGCGASPIQILELAVTSVELALPIIEQTAGVDPATIAAVQNYLGAVSQGITKASDILAGPGTDAEKAAQIVAVFAGIAVPVVPAQYQAIVTAVQQVAQNIAQFIGSLPSPATVSSSTHSVSASEKTKLHSIKIRAQAIPPKLLKGR